MDIEALTFLTAGTPRVLLGVRRAHGAVHRVGSLSCRAIGIRAAIIEQGRCRRKRSRMFAQMRTGREGHTPRPYLRNHTDREVPASLLLYAHTISYSTVVGTRLAALAACA